MENLVYDQRMKEAINLYRNAEKSAAPLKIPELARQYQLDYMMLYRKLKNNRGAVEKVGRKPYLDQMNEMILLRWIAKAILAGLPPTRTQIQEYVRRYLSIVLKKDLAVSRSWYKRFQENNVEICLRKAQFITKANACVTEAEIRSWFT